jgi:hypothetical protein
VRLDRLDEEIMRLRAARRHMQVQEEQTQERLDGGGQGAKNGSRRKQ